MIEKYSCAKCNKYDNGDVYFTEIAECYDLCSECYIYISDNVHLYLKNLIQPERSKRENSQCEMRCSEHCGNTVSEAK